MFLITGLGNPGPRYQETRHNIGQLVLEQFASEFASSAKWTDKGDAELAEARVGEYKVLLLRPCTYMNESGKAVGPIWKFYKFEPEQLIVVHDELDLTPGTVRIKAGGGVAGHNGLRDIARAIGTEKFLRVRIGIGHPRELTDGQMDVSNWVLSGPSNSDRKLLKGGVSLGVRALELLILFGLTEAQREIHSQR